MGRSNIPSRMRLWRSLLPSFARPPCCAGRLNNVLKRAKAGWGWINTNIGPGPRGIGTCSMYFWGCIFCYNSGSNLKKTPALTLPQAQRLMAAVLPLRTLTVSGAIRIVRYHTRRNHVAYVSHRKKAIAKAKLLKRKMTL